MTIRNIVIIVIQIEGKDIIMGINLICMRRVPRMEAGRGNKRY